MGGINYGELNNISGDLTVTGNITAGKVNLLTPWTNFYNSLGLSWVVYGGGYFYPSYCRDANGFVHLRGTMKGGSNGVIYTFPAGLRPGNTVAFPVIGYNGTSYSMGYMTINNSGQMNIQLTSGYNQWVPLDGITWYGEV
jgi:hypothetical protein